MDDIDVKRLRLQPGDIVIVTLRGNVPDPRGAAASIRDALDNAGHQDMKFLMLTGDTEISVLSRDAILVDGKSGQ